MVMRAELSDAFAHALCFRFSPGSGILFHVRSGSELAIHLFGFRQENIPVCIAAVTNSGSVFPSNHTGRVMCLYFATFIAAVL